MIATGPLPTRTAFPGSTVGDESVANDGESRAPVVDLALMDLPRSPLREGRDLEELELDETEYEDASPGPVITLRGPGGLPLFGSSIENSEHTMRPAISSALISKLKTLDLSNVRIGDDGAEWIANENQLSNLKRLRLRGCGFSTRGAIALSQSPLNWSLEELDLIHNPFSARIRAQLQERFGSAVKFWHEVDNVR